LVVNVVKADPSHIPALASSMRAEDVAECYAYGRSPAQALEESLARATYAYTAIADGEPIAMWGVREVGLLGGEAVVWCLTGEGIWRHKKTFLRGSRAFAEYLRKRYSTVWNLVDSRYTRAIRWLKWMGFSIHGKVMVGDVPFYLAVLRRET